LLTLNFYTACDDALKPVVGMKFDCIHVVEEFYKAYAHEVGFLVRIGAQGKVIDVVENKRFLCSRQGFSKNRLTGTISPILKKPKKCAETRCECNAHIYIKLGSNNRYYIASMVEEHNHGLVSPNKIHFLRSNRSISQRVKTTLFMCHKASIGVS
jgi:hypothetical protein